MRRPSLTGKVVRGLNTVFNDAHAMLTEREGWQPGKSDTPERDADEWRALEYIQALIWWYEEQEATNETLP